MERNCVSLETAKKLKAAGFPQTAIYAWCQNDNRWFVQRRGDRHRSQIFAAPTAQEIADELPTEGLKLEYIQKKWVAHYPDKMPATGPTLAQALAALYLKLNKETT